MPPLVVNRKIVVYFKNTSWQQQGNVEFSTVFLRHSGQWLFRPCYEVYFCFLKRCLCINLCCALAGHSTSSLSTVQPKDPPEPTDKRDPYIAVPSLTQHESTGKPWNGNGRLHFCPVGGRKLLQFHAASSRPAQKASDAVILAINYCASGKERIIKQRL